MRAVKYIMIWMYLVCAVFCVRFAHSEEIRYSTPALTLKYCELSVETHDGLLIFKPSAATHSAFFGFTPDDDGEVEMTASRANPTGKHFGTGESQVDETLTVSFSSVSGHVQPVAYSYAKDKGLGLERTFECHGLIRRD